MQREGEGGTNGESIDIYSPPCASLVAQAVKHPPAMQETWVRSLGWKDPLEKEMATHSVSLSGKSQRQKSLAGYTAHGVAKSRTRLRD